jgi:hypothetical protein
MQEENLYKEINKWKKIAVSLTLFVVISVIGTISFILGRQSAKVSLKTVPTDKDAGNYILGSKSNVSTAPELNKDVTPTPEKGSENLTTTPNPQPTSSTKTKKIILNAVNRLDGFRSSNGSGSTSSNIRAGRDSKLVTRFFVSFDLTELPDDIEVVSANLRIFQTKTMGDPYKTGGDLLIDHLNYGDSLDSSDYSTPALLSSFETFSDKPTTGWREVEVTSEVIDDVVSARQFSQFRLHFEKELAGGDENGDFAYFESSEDTQRSGNTPELVIEYTQ